MLATLTPANTPSYDPTIEDSYSVTRAVDGHSYYLMLTDTAGQEEYRGLWAASNLQSDAFLLVYDITSAPSLPALDYFMEMIAMESEHRIDSHRPPPVKIVAGNKCDLPAQRQIDAKTGLEWARKHGCGFMETSAREMVNIEETFALLVRRVVEARVNAGRGGVGHEGKMGFPTTPKLPAQGEKVGRVGDVGDEGAEGKGGFWGKLKCW
jgi:small GTP-binding protein